MHTNSQAYIYIIHTHVMVRDEGQGWRLLVLRMGTLHLLTYTIKQVFTTNKYILNKQICNIINLSQE